MLLTITHKQDGLILGGAISPHDNVLGIASQACNNHFGANDCEVSFDGMVTFTDNEGQRCSEEVLIKVED